MSAWTEFWRKHDPDSIFAYKTPRIAVIQDRRLGMMNILFSLGILAYIIIVVFVNGGYQMRESPRGSARLSVRAPTVGPSTNISGLPYCEENGSTTALPLSCILVDEKDVSFLVDLQGSAYFPTRVNMTYEKKNENGTFQIAEVPSSEPSAYYATSVEDSTVKLSISGTAPTIGISASNDDIEAEIHPCSEDVEEPFRTTNTIFTLREMLRWACVPSLDVPSDTDPSGRETYRYAGGVLVMRVTFTNNPLSLRYDFTFLRKTEYKHTSTVLSTDGLSRRFLSSHGILLKVEITGTVGVFHFPTLIIQLSASLGLLAVAKVVTDTIALYMLPEKAEYAAVKFEVSDDFSDIRQRKTIGNIQERLQTPGASRGGDEDNDNNISNFCNTSNNYFNDNFNNGNQDHDIPPPMPAALPISLSSYYDSESETDDEDSSDIEIKPHKVTSPTVVSPASSSSSLGVHGQSSDISISIKTAQITRKKT